MAAITQNNFESLLKDQADAALAQIVEAVRAGTCNLFLGAAVHAPPPDNPALAAKLPPIGNKLAAILASDPVYQRFYPNDDTSNLARVAQTYESLFMRERLVSKVEKLVETGKEPSPILRALAELDFPVVVTTNYDTLFQKALIDAGKMPILSVYHSNEEGIPVENCEMTDAPQTRHPFLHKMHGDIQTRESLVITDEDYVQFILRMRDSGPFQVIPEAVLEAFKKAPTLFVGYSLRDYDLRTLWKWLRKFANASRRPTTYSIDLHPDRIIWDVWYNQRRFINFIALDVWKFVPDLYLDVKGKPMPV